MRQRFIVHRDQGEDRDHTAWRHGAGGRARTAGGAAPPGDRGAHTHSDARYGGLPSYLPKPKIPTQRVVTARLAHPKLAIEGDTVEIVLPHARARATIVGPYVPDKDQGTFQNTANVSFDATFASVRGTVPLAASMFTISDELGAVHHPKITVRHGGRLPVRLPRGKPITLVLRTTLPFGNVGALGTGPPAVTPSRRGTSTARPTDAHPLVAAAVTCPSAKSWLCVNVSSSVSSTPVEVRWIPSAVSAVAVFAIRKRSV